MTLFDPWRLGCIHDVSRLSENLQLRSHSLEPPNRTKMPASEQRTVFRRALLIYAESAFDFLDLFKDIDSGFAEILK